MASDGLLVLLEGAVPVRFADLTVGLTEGWWKFSDTDLRPSYALLSETKWLAVLAKAGFRNSLAIPAREDRVGVLATQSVILSSAPAAPWSEEKSVAPAPRKSWLIFADSGGVAGKISRLACGKRR